jgi:hypothetical protein
MYLIEKKWHGETGAQGARRVPEWEEYPHTPGVFVRVANKRLAGYGTWKSVRRMGGRDRRIGRAMSSRLEILGTHPAVFVRVGNKGDK